MPRRGIPPAYQRAKRREGSTRNRAIDCAAGTRRGWRKRAIRTCPTENVSTFTSDSSCVESEGRHLFMMRFYLKPADWTWWAWTITAVLLAVGLGGHDRAYIAAMVLTA